MKVGNDIWLMTASIFLCWPKYPCVVLLRPRAPQFAFDDNRLARFDRLLAFSVVLVVFSRNILLHERPRFFQKHRLHHELLYLIWKTRCHETKLKCHIFKIHLPPDWPSPVGPDIARALCINKIKN